MFSAPRHEILVFREHRFDDLVEHIFGRFAEELGVGVQRLVVLAIEARDVPHDLLAAGSGFDHWHGDVLLTRMRCSSKRLCRGGFVPKET
jgi:hypothetical protein